MLPDPGFSSIVERCLIQGFHPLTNWKVFFVKYFDFLEVSPIRLLLESKIATFFEPHFHFHLWTPPFGSVLVTLSVGL